ncbi:hypothetical protein LCGC14_0245870 [marine sediment metagenome]|uniref:Uncharacterized protein n=1 Tax=marine sediment metagenome TaxID=412755 RepID=A0A0F9WR31_9ZZZZ
MPKIRKFKVLKTNSDEEFQTQLNHYEDDGGDVTVHSHRSKSVPPKQIPGYTKHSALISYWTDGSK